MPRDSGGAMSNAAKSGDPGLSEAAQRAAQRIQKAQQEYDRASFPLGKHDITEIIVSEMSLAASAGVSELREALQKYHDAIDAIYNESLAGRALVVKHFGTIHPNPVAVLKKHGDGI